VPKGGANGRHAATLGGWQLCRVEVLKKPGPGCDLVMYLNQRCRAEASCDRGFVQPTIASLYKDKDVLARSRFFGSLYETFVNAVPRPSTPTGTKYNQVSSEFWNTTSAVLSGQGDAAGAVKALDEKLTRLSRGGKW